MQVKLDDEVLFEIDDRMINLMGHDLLDPIPDIKRRLRWIIEHKCDRCFERMEKEWMQRLRKDPSIQSIPLRKTDFVDMVLAHPDYRNRVQREQDELDRQAEQALKHQKFLEEKARKAEEAKLMESSEI